MFPKLMAAESPRRTETGQSSADHQAAIRRSATHDFADPTVQCRIGATGHTPHGCRRPPESTSPGDAVEKAPAPVRSASVGSSPDRCDRLPPTGAGHEWLETPRGPLP